MIAVREQSYYSKLHSEQTSKEIVLVQAAALRASLLVQKTKYFTSEQREVIKQGEDALRQLLSTYRGLILRLVAEYKTKGYNSPNLDLEQEATLAFLDAVKSFEPEKGTILATWAFFQIRARLQRITGQAIHQAIASAKAHLSEQVFSAPEPILEQGVFEQIRSVLNKLTSLQRQVVSLTLEGLGWTEIALKLQSTADAVRMVWTRSVQRLRLLLLGGEQQEEQQSEVVESPPDEQPNNFSESQTIQQPNNFSQPLFKHLFRPVDQTFIFWRLCKIALSKMRKVKQHNQQNNQSLILIFSASQNSDIYRFWSDSSCSKGARGSPLTFLPSNCLTALDG